MLGVAFRLRNATNLWWCPTKYGWNALHAKPCIKRYCYSFCASVGYSCLFQKPWNRHKRMWSKYAQNVTWCWFLILLGVEQNRRLGRIPACSLLLDFQRESTVCHASCDECSCWDVLVEDRMLGSTLWLIWPSNWLSEGDLVFQFLPNTSISIPSESKSLTNLAQFPDLVVWPCDRPKKVWTLHEVGQLSCAPTRTSVQHSFELDTACRSSKLWCLWIFSFWFWHLCLWWSASRTISASPLQLCYLLVLPVEYIQDILDQVVTLGLPIRLAFAVLPTSSACSELFLPLFVSSTYTDKNNCNLRWR